MANGSFYFIPTLKIKSIFLTKIVSFWVQKYTRTEPEPNLNRTRTGQEQY